MHDLAGTVLVIRLARDVGDEEGVIAGLDVLGAFLQPDEIKTIRLRRLVRSMVLLVSRSIDFMVGFDSITDTTVTVRPAHLHALIVNILLNATEAAALTDKPFVNVVLHKDRLVIENSANERDRKLIVSPIKDISTRGSRRGIGRRSIERCCYVMGWDIEYATTDDKVIVIVSWPDEKGVIGG